MTTTRCLSSRELIKPESVTHVLRQKCHPCPGLHTKGERTLICRVLMRKGLEMEWVR